MQNFSYSSANKHIEMFINVDSNDQITLYEYCHIWHTYTYMHENLVETSHVWMYEIDNAL